MLNFKPLDLEDREIFLKYLRMYHFRTYEYSFLNLYLWRKYCNVEYAIIKDALVIKKNEKKIGAYFMQPLGYTPEHLNDIIAELIKIKDANPDIKYLFRDIEEPFLQELKSRFDDKIQFCEDVNNFDYIYEKKQLVSLPGKKLHKKKNLYNQFVSSYDYEIKDIYDADVIKDCIQFSQDWYKSQDMPSEHLTFEVDGIRDVLTNMDKLDAIGMAVYVDNTIIGFTVSEKVNACMAVIHIEKADTQYKGAYAFINKTFAELYLNDVTYINREEDLGIIGLRQAKEAYKPTKLEKKYIVNIL